MRRSAPQPVPLELFPADRPRVVNAKDLPAGWERDDRYCYVGRPGQGIDPRTLKPGEHGWLGNPFDVRAYGKAEALGNFRRDLAQRMLGSVDWARAVLGAIRGRQLVCFCVDPRGRGDCHARIYVEIEETPVGERRALLERWRDEGGPAESPAPPRTVVSPDVVVTVPKGIWLDWIAEGDAAGEPDTGEEWGFYLGGPEPRIEPGARVYVVAHGRLRGYSTLRRIGHRDGRWALVRGGGAVAVTIPEAIKGFQGWRYRWWNVANEVPFPNWRREGVR